MDSIAGLLNFSGWGGTVLAFVLALSIIVAIHEYGHYIIGRVCGIQADVFSIGFGPVIAHWTDRRGTRWQIAALPLGGYVKFRGDADAASATQDGTLAQMSEAERRSTMAGAPLWARAATVAAGPVFNFIFSIFVFAGLIFSSGEVSSPFSIERLYAVPTQHELREGDILRRIEDYNIANETGGVAQALSDLPKQHLLAYQVERDGQRIDVAGPYPFPPLVTNVAPKSAASAAGMRSGDVILRVNGRDVVAFTDLKEFVETSQGAELALTIWRDGQEETLALTPRRVDEPAPEGGFVTQWRVGIIGGLVFEPATEYPSLPTALQGGVVQTYNVVANSLSGLYHMITGAISSCNISGPIGIAEASGDMARQGAQSFVWFIALLSTAVGLLNLFPIPVLDGGHLVFHAYEAVTGRPPSERALRVLMGAGFALLLSLMLFAVSNDLFCP